MTNVAHTCVGCGIRIGADDLAVLLMRELPVRGGSIDPTGFHEERQVAHKADEAYWTTLGYRGTRDGPLRELVP